jgi:hypothetical protein
MRPESTSVTFRADLSALLNEFDAAKAARRFIGRRAAPLFRVPKISAGFPIMNRENYKKPASVNRAPDGGYNRVVGEFGKGTYDCEEHGLEQRIDDRMLERYGSLFNAETAAQQMLWYQILLNHEIRVAALFSGGGHTNHNVTTAWSTTATAVPINDIQTGIDTLMDNCGCGPEDITMIIPRDDYKELLQVAQINNKMLYTYPGIQPAQMRPDQLAGMLGLKQVLPARSSYDATEEGYAESMSQIWTAGVIYLAVTADEGDDIMMPSAARTIIWEPSAAELPVVETYREDRTRSDILRVRDDTDEVLLGATDLFVYQITNT